MTCWQERDTFTTQFASEETQAGISAKAPCPSDFGQGRSYWIEEYRIDFEEECRSAVIPSDVDIAIIGTGITAAAAVYELARKAPGLKVAMLEARGICTGATGRNGGHIARAEAFDFRQLANKFGTDDAVRMRELGTRTRDMLLAAVDECGGADAVDLRLSGTTVIFASKEERDAYQKDEEACRQAGMYYEGRVLEGSEVLQKINVSPEIAKFGAAHIAKSGSIQPRKLVAALLADARRRMRNLSIHPYNPVRSVSQDQNEALSSYTVATDKGKLRGRVVIHATNAYASYLIPSLQGTNGVFGCKAEVIAVQPNCDTAGEQGIKCGGLGYDEMWHWAVQRPHNGPFIYGWSGVEALGDYDDSKVVADGQNDANRTRTEWLETALPACFKDLQWDRDVLYQWTGIQGFTSQGTSFVGRSSPDSLGEFMSVGHNGEGMGRCFACSAVLVDKVLHYLEHGEGSGKKWSAPEWFPRAYLHNI